MYDGREEKEVTIHRLGQLDLRMSTSGSLAFRLQDIITEISEKEKNFKILVYANGFKKIRITEKIIKELGIDTFAYERTNVGRRRRAMKEKVYYSKWTILELERLRQWITEAFFVVCRLQRDAQ